MGYFLRAWLQFAHLNISDSVSMIHCILSAHAQAMHDSPWKGLPELTNKDGTKCMDSCTVHAGSMATQLDMLYDLKEYSY